MKGIKKRLLGKVAGSIRNVAEKANAENHFSTKGFYKPQTPVINVQTSK